MYSILPRILTLPPVRCSRQENTALEPFTLAIKRKARSDSSANASDILDMSQDIHDEDRNRATASVFDRPMLRIPKRPRLLGSPFDLAKRIETRRTKSRRLIDADEEGDMRDSDFDASLNLNMSGASASSSGSGPQRSGLPTGDVFSPRDGGGRRGGRGSINYDFSGSIAGSMRPAWLYSPEDAME